MPSIYRASAHLDQRRISTRPLSACAVVGCRDRRVEWLSQGRRGLTERTKAFAKTLRRRASMSGCGSSRLRLVYDLDTIENLAEIALRDLNIIVILQIEPKLRRCAERLGEPKRGIGGNSSLLAGDTFDPRARQAASLGKSTRRHLQRNQELLPQNLSGMHRLELLGLELLG